MCNVSAFCLLLINTCCSMSTIFLAMRYCEPRSILVTYSNKKNIKNKKWVAISSRISKTYNLAVMDFFFIILKHKNTERATIVIYYYIDKTYVTIVLYVGVQSQNMKIVHFNIIKLLTLAPAVKTNEKN